MVHGDSDVVAGFEMTAINRSVGGDRDAVTVGEFTAFFVAFKGDDRILDPGIDRFVGEFVRAAGLVAFEAARRLTFLELGPVVGVLDLLIDSGPRKLVVRIGGDLDDLAFALRRQPLLDGGTTAQDQCSRSDEAKRTEKFHIERY